MGILYLRAHQQYNHERYVGLHLSIFQFHNVNEPYLMLFLNQSRGDVVILILAMQHMLKRLLGYLQQP